MDVSEMISALGDHGFADTLSSTKVRELQNAIWQIEATEQWPFLETTLDLDFDGTSPVATNMPSGGWHASMRVKDLVAQRRIPFSRLDDFEDMVGTNYDEVGDPQLYYFEGGQLKFWPIPPASTDRVKWRYIKVSAEITDSTVESAIPLPKHHHELIVVKALAKLYRMEDDLELASYFEGASGELMQRMKDNLFRQQIDQPDYVRVLDWDDYDYF